MINDCPAKLMSCSAEFLHICKFGCTNGHMNLIDANEGDVGQSRRSTHVISYLHLDVKYTLKTFDLDSEERTCTHTRLSLVITIISRSGG